MRYMFAILIHLTSKTSPSHIICYRSYFISSERNQPSILIVNSPEMHQYLQLYPPALDWILQCIAEKSPEVR